MSSKLRDVYIAGAGITKWGVYPDKYGYEHASEAMLFLVKRNSEKNRAKIRNSPFGNPKKIAGHFCLMRACFMR